MFATILVVAALLPLASDESRSPALLAEYQAARTRAGRDSEAHVKLALWCESHGLKAERTTHLAIAVLNDPKNHTARGLLGQVIYQGQWQRPEAVPDRVLADADLSAALAEYNARRGRAAMTADAQWRLALWCQEHGLDAEAKAHLTSVVRLDPGHAAAWKRLGCKKVGGRWVSAEQLAAEKADAAAQKEADARWKSLLSKYRGWLGGHDEAKRLQAEAALAQVTDPRAVPAVWAVFVAGGGRGQALAVPILGQIDGAEATRALAVLGVFSPSAEVRRVATETLRRRDLREVVGWLIALIRKPMRYEVRPVDGPGSPGVLFVEGERFNVQRVYAPPPLPNIPLFPGEPITYDAAGLPVVSRFLGPSRKDVVIRSRGTMVTAAQYFGHAPADPATTRLIAEARRNPQSEFFPGRRPTMVIAERLISSTPYETTVQVPIGQILLQYQTAAAASRQQEIADVQALEGFNAAVGRSNERVLGVLTDITGHDEGADPQAWAAWWTDQQGYVYKPPTSDPKPTIVENVPLAYVPQPVPTNTQVAQTGPATISTTVTGTNHSCFRAGTSVRTLTGSRPIESIAVGDRVLVEDTATGALSYQATLAVFHNRPAQLYRVELGDETIWATGIHRFWKAGQGWTMARDLKSGDVLRTLGSMATVGSVEAGPVEPVFNLEVAGGQSFFVGRLGALVHDNSLVRPVDRPFDAGTRVRNEPPVEPVDAARN